MGAGIAQVAALNGYSVTLVDVSPNSIEKGKKMITSSLARVTKKKFADKPEAATAFFDEVLSRISLTTETHAGGEKADLIIEAIIENMKLKHSLFETLDKFAPAHAIFASNTSSLPISEIAKAAPKRKENFAGIHFFNPVPQMKLVEVIRINDTKQQVVDDLVAFSKSLGKVPVLCKDTPGYCYPCIQLLIV